MFGLTIPLWAIPLIIFTLRIGDCSIGTVRVIYTIRGYRLISFCLGFVESVIWIVAISQVMQYLNEPQLKYRMFNIIGWAAGFAMGTVTGISLDKWIAAGWVLTRFISIDHSDKISGKLRDAGFGVTSLHGEGKNGPVDVLFVVSPRKRAQQVLRIVREIDPDAFTTVEPVSNAQGGFVPNSAAGIRK